MKFSIIVAVSENNVIGLNGEMPWPKMKSDLKWFKEKTLGKWCILGRKSYNALGNKVLPGRKFIVVTRDNRFESVDSIVAHELNEAMHLQILKDEKEIMILGGGEIYKQGLKYTDRIYLTKIHASYEGDTFFPVLKFEDWKIITSEFFTADEKNPHDYTFTVLERK